MAERLVPKGKFDIPDVPDFVPRRLKPWLFILFVLCIQFSGGIYMAAASYMVGDKALMQEDILMAGYASLIGMALNFAVMFRIKFRYSSRTQLLSCCTVLIIANIVCTLTQSVPLMVLACFIAGWFRMQGTFCCNSTIQLWLTPYRDMSVFFCYVYLVVDGVIQLSGISAVYASELMQWEYMHWIMCGILAVTMILVLIFIRPMRCPMFIPLLGIDWIGSLLWGIFMMCFAFVCVYGNYFDWWDAQEISCATIIGICAMAVNLWRASFLHHPYISFQAMTNRNVVLTTLGYAVFFTLLATEHVFEHGYAAHVLGFDETNLADLNWYVFAGILAGIAMTYYCFARRKWQYRTMTAIGFILVAAYLAWFYFGIGNAVEKEALFVPLFLRGAGAVIISIVFLTSIVQSGLPFMVFPQALTINGFSGAVLGATLGPAIVGEWLSHVMARNASLLGALVTDANPKDMNLSIEATYGMVQQQAMIVSMKEIYGWLLILGIISIILIVLSPVRMRPFAIFPKWRTIRQQIKHVVRAFRREQQEENQATAG